MALVVVAIWLGEWFMENVVADRHKTVPHPDRNSGTFGLTEEQLASYQQHGFLVLRGVFMPE